MKPLPMLKRFEVTVTLKLTVLAHNEDQARVCAMAELAHAEGEAYEVRAVARELRLPDNVALFRRH